MRVVILCGGQGTRIRDANEALPKPLLPIGGRPIVWHIMKGYAAHGYRDFVLCLGYKGWLIKEFFLNYRAMTDDVQVELGQRSSISFLGAGEHEDWSVLLAETGEHAGTGARISAVRKYVDGHDVFLLTYGDGVANVNIDKLLEFHRANGKLVTITAVRPPSRFGEMRMQGPLVTEFNEKPQATEGFINGGFMVCDAKRIWDYLPADPNLMFESGPLSRLAKERQLAAFEHDGFWQPMDTPREFKILNDLWASGHAPWKTWP